MTLTWTNDPQLLDKHPINYNNWETANTLIEQEGLKRVINEDLSFTNLYGIMVRKVDFVRVKSSDRIIARFPFLVINKEMQELIQKNILLISEAVRDYFYKSINKSIMQWKEIILNYLAKGSLPFPIFRCSFELEPTLLSFCNKNLLHFTSARGEAFTFPTKITSKLAYLCGICNGDGNLRDYWIIIADETKEHIEFISNMLNDLFSKKGKLMKTGGAWIVKLNLLWAVRLFNFITNQSIDEPKYDSLREPVLFQHIGDPFRNLYWRGAFDADGSFKNQIVFCSMSKVYTKDFQNYLSSNNIESNFFTKTNGGYQVNILAKNKINFADLIGSNHPKKLKDFLNYMQKSTQNYEFRGFNSNKITADGYFDFQFLPTVAVLGLETYFRNINSKASLFTSQELQQYQTSYGITIKKLLKHLHRTNTKLMLLLLKYEKNLLFRSASSTPIRLPLKPSTDFSRLAACLIPTVNGARLYQSNEELLILRKELFGITNRSGSYSNKLLGKFLRTFGKYERFSVNVVNYKHIWLEDLEKN